MFLEGIITPIPSELIVPFAGHLASLGKMDLLFVVLAATIGSTLGSTVSYLLAMVLGRPVLLRYGRWIFVDEEILDKADRFFAEKGRFAVLFGHMVPGVRSIISYPAGIAKMDPKRFMLFTFGGGLFWNSVLALIGHELGSSWMDFWKMMDGWDVVIVAAIGLAALIYLYRRWKRKNNWTGT
ncbi:MAG: DedA family protein [Methanomassiliicoccales archaeon]|nr:MAG: DedA family protein [Methanomassiliicoccales archaeon]